MTTLEALSARLAVCEDAAKRVRTGNVTLQPASLAPVVAHCTEAALLGCQLHQVPSPYYSWALPRRATELNCTVEQLCKTIVLENVAAPELSPLTPASLAQLPYCRYFAVIVQYCAKCDVHAIERYLRALAARSGGAVPDVKLRMAAGAAELTGFEFNAVTPLGSLTRIPVIVSKAITQLPAPASVWIGL
ncbi:hypothetical protein EON66_08785 [archaeon]|nr:MAG: hypothetical protein EON66_08785 [archaeon]